MAYAVRMPRLAFSAEQTAWYPWTQCKNSESRPPHSPRNLDAPQEGRSRSLHVRVRSNFMARRSTICEMTCLMRTIGLQIARACPSRENARTTSGAHSVGPSSRTERFSSFPTRDFVFDCRKLHYLWCQT